LTETIAVALAADDSKYNRDVWAEVDRLDPNRSGFPGSRVLNK